MQEMMVLVDENDNERGEMEKMDAHRKGILHRAFSGFVLNDQGELLLQKRAAHKYHNPGIWANTVCSHPRKGETAAQAANRRVQEELGFSANFTEVGKFVYKASFTNGLTEHELDHVCVAKYNGQLIKPNADEVETTRWILRSDLEKEIKKAPQNFSFWLKEILRLGILNYLF